MENNGTSLSFFSGCESGTSSQISTPLWLGPVGGSTSSARVTDSTAIFPPYHRSGPVELSRMKLKRRLHSRSPLSSIENLPRVPPARVGPMKVGLKEDDVLVMDAVMLGSNTNRFAQGMEELYGSASGAIKPIAAVEKTTNSKPTSGSTKSRQYSVTVPAQKKKVTQNVRDYSSWISTEEEDYYFMEMLYGPSDKKRLPVFINICPE